MRWLPGLALGEADQEYRAYARQVVANAQALTEGLSRAGYAAGHRRHRYHLALLDLQRIGVTGVGRGDRWGEAGIMLNKNAIPYDPQPPSMASGIRVGSPSVTTQGMAKAR